MRVLKFGGAALRDGPAVRQAARIVRAEGGERPLVVVSAHEGVTSLLERTLESVHAGRLEWDPLRIRHRTILRQLELPGDLLDRHLRELRSILELIGRRTRPDRRIRDLVLSFGERMSARVFSAVLRRAGVPATPLDAFDLGFSIGSGRPERMDPAPARVGQALRGVPGVPVVTGFLALDDAGHLTTLGRNGSDLSAVWFAEAVGAREVQLWKTVPGVMTADPRLVPRARPLAALGWAEAAELAAHGSEILHPTALEPARRAGIRVSVRNVEDPRRRGTVVEGKTPSRGPVAVAHRPQLVRLRVALGRNPQQAELWTALAEVGLEPVLAGFAGTTGEVFLTEPHRFADPIEVRGLRSAPERGWASAALVGRGVGDDLRLALRLEERMRREGIETRRAPGGGRSRSLVFITRSDAVGQLVDFLHRTCLEEERSANQEPSAEGRRVRPIS